MNKNRTMLSTNCRIRWFGLNCGSNWKGNEIFCAKAMVSVTRNFIGKYFQQLINKK